MTIQQLKCAHLAEAIEVYQRMPTQSSRGRFRIVRKRWEPLVVMGTASNVTGVIGLKDRLLDLTAVTLRLERNDRFYVLDVR